MQTGEQGFLNEGARSANLSKIWFYPNPSFQTPSSNDDVLHCGGYGYRVPTRLLIRLEIGGGPHLCNM